MCCETYTYEFDVRMVSEVNSYAATLIFLTDKSFFFFLQPIGKNMKSAYYLLVEFASVVTILMTKT